MGKGQAPWISEMYGYVFAAAEAKLKHILTEGIVVYPDEIGAGRRAPQPKHAPQAPGPSTAPPRRAWLSTAPALRLRLSLAPTLSLGHRPCQAGGAVHHPLRAALRGRVFPLHQVLVR